MKTDHDQNQNITENFDIVAAVMQLARTIKRTNHGFHPIHERHYEDGPHHSHHKMPYIRGGLGDMRLLNVIAENDNASSRELAEIIDIRPSSLSEMLNRLEGNKLIRRFRDAHDSRIIHVALTNDGIAYMNDVTDNHLQLHQRMSGCLNNDEKKVFIDYCRRLMDAAKEGAER